MPVTLTSPLVSSAGDDVSPVQTKTKREIILFNILNFYDIYWEYSVTSPGLELVCTLLP